MSSEEPLPAKIQRMLEDLPPQARAALQLAIDKARELGRSDMIYALLNQQLKTTETTVTPLRMPEPSRLFFNPLEPFLIDEQPPQKTSGRIWRSTLQPIWAWIEHHTVPEAVSQCRQHLAELEGKIFSANDPALLAIENDLRKTILPQLHEGISRAQQTPDTRRRFAHHVGGDYQLQELEDIYSLLKCRDVIDSFSKSLPATLSHMAAADVATVSKLFSRLAGIEPRLPYYASVLLQKRLEQPTHLPLWAFACAGSDDLRVVANSPFAAMIEIALGDAARMADLCINDLTKPAENNRSAHYVRQYALICRNLRAAVDFDSQTSDWLKRLSEIRLRISNVLAQELGELFQLMRRNVRPLRAFGTQAPYPPDDFDLSRLCFLIAILNTVRSNGQEFALNELVNRLYGECDGYLQLTIDSLMQDLRTTTGDKRRIVQAYADAAVRISRIWHGEEHANVLKRGFDTAAATPAKTPDSKASA